MTQLIDSPDLSLLDIPVDSVCSVKQIDAFEDQAARLAGLGISAGRKVRVIRRGDPTIVQVYGTRIGLAKSLARRVRVVFERALSNA